MYHGACMQLKQQMLSSRIFVLSAVLLGFCQGKDADTVRLFMKLKGGASELANTRASKQQSTQLKRELAKILLGIRATSTPLLSSLILVTSVVSGRAVGHFCPE